MDLKVTVAIVGAAATVIAALITRLFQHEKQSGAPPSQQQAGSNNFQASGNISVGGGVTFVSQAERTDGMIEVTDVRFTRDAEFDVLVRNVGDTDVIVHQITIMKLKDLHGMVLPVLHPTAKYHLPVDDIPVGQSKSLSVSHIVPARSGDRFLIALETTSGYLLEVTLHYNRDSVVAFKKDTWNFLQTIVP